MLRRVVSFGALLSLSFLALTGRPAAISGQEKSEAKDEAVAEDNPYLVPAEASLDDLVSFLDRSQRRPATIRLRPQFVEAIADAAERILKKEPKDAQRKLAAITMFELLHAAAVLDNPDADKKLMFWAEKLAKDPIPEVSSAAGLHVLEKRVMDARQKGLDEAEAGKLLDELKAYLSDKKLERKHLRLCSETIGVINDSIKDSKVKDKQFDTFGELYAKSEDKTLRSYGRSVLKKPGTGGGDSALVGKKLEIVGKTVDGADFNLDMFKGKIVLVDFWATWCGPCRAELPHVKAAYEKYHKLGFEVVAISLDRDREELEKYIKEQEITWTNLFDDDAGGSHPMATKYGVRAIPTAILVDKEGKVISASARGEQLTKLLEKHLGEKPETVEPKEGKGGAGKGEPKAAPKS